MFHRKSYFRHALRSVRIAGLFCFCHQMNQMNLMDGEMYCLVKSGASGDDFYDSGISVIR